jgi:hypothetical protein
MARSSRLLRWVASTAVVLMGGTAVIGFAHTPMGKPLLAWTRPLLRATGQSCPLGFDATATPAQREEARFMFSLRHAHPDGLLAKSRPALGFTLDVTTREEVAAWATSRGLNCAKPRTGPDFECTGVDAAQLPEAYRGSNVDALWFNFGLHGELISLTAVRRDSSAQGVEQTYQLLQKSLTRDAGPLFHTEGDASILASAPLRQASSELRFRDYYALVRATNVGDSYVVTEEYRSLTRGTP